MGLTIEKRKYNESLAEGFTFLVFSIFLTHYASRYAKLRASNPVDDLILSNTTVHNMETIFVQGAIALSLFVVLLSFRYYKGAPYLLKTVALFISTRALFVMLTHIGPFPLQLDLESNLLNFITTGNDLFFSGHTGLPFLLGLIFWKHPLLRYFFVTSSIVLGGAALLSHLHYSIDVFAAFFITHSIYTLSKKFFKNDYEQFDRTL
jgi:hypothetical protein